MSLSLPELVWSSDRRVWARHPGFLASHEDITRLTAHIRGQGFLRFLQDECVKQPRLFPYPNSPVESIPAACPPTTRGSHDILSLTLFNCGEKIRVGAGFLRFMGDRWYFCHDGMNVVPDLSEATLWKDIHASGQGGER